MYTGQRDATMEGVFADRRDTVGDVHTGQRHEISKSLITDRCDTRYNDYTFDIFRYLIYAAPEVTILPFFHLF